MSEKTQMTHNVNFWRDIRIRLSQFLQDKTNETGVGFLPGTIFENVALAINLHWWPFYLSLYRPIPIFCPQFASTRSLNFDTFYLTNDLV